MLTLDEATLIFGLPTRLIFQWVQEGLIHSLETADSGLFVCPESLRDMKQK